ncbi:glycosyltransferase [Arcanobacterium phocisimile]|uniref:Glycosyltransferase n=1 Tax=Arcanobacterium phocisimile TaxID=1302235 RepID=A0ABX7IH26_9ACTO|nr:glycosyltransferase [Arcanobacterium phocisimile]QRV01869.1 glycosyltransferase [Arcanobacterium phocisimile]
MNEFSRDRVTAVVISQRHDVAFLPETLHALKTQTYQATHVVVGVAEPEHVSIVADAYPDADVVTIGEQKTFGRAVAATIENRPLTDPWIWFLHADSAPEHQSLELLVQTGEASRQIGAVGAKQIGWGSQHRTLLEVGIRATRSARRIPDVEPGEIDQGQLDSRTDVLAVGSAGMLVRASTFDECSGFDEAFGPFGEGLELCRRFRCAGFRVVIEPKARVRHKQISLGQPRVISFAARRAAQLHNALIAAPTVLVPFLWLSYVVGSIPRAFLRLMGKDVAYSRAELVAGWKLAGLLPAIYHSRRRNRAVRRVPRRALAALEEKPWSVRLAKRQSRRAHADAAALSQAPDQFTIMEWREHSRGVRIGRMLTLALSTVLAGIIFIPVASNGALTGGGLAVSSLTGFDLTREAMTGWISSADGFPGTIDPLWVFLSLPLALLQPFQITLGQLVTVLMYLALPLVALLAYAAVGRVVVSWPARVVLTVVWIVSPVFLISLATGRVAGVVAFTGLSGCAYALGGAWRNNSRDASMLAFFMMIASLAAPIFSVLCVGLCVLGFIAHQRRWRWFFLALPAMVVHLPGLYLARERYLFTTTGIVQRDLSSGRDVLDLVPYASPWPLGWSTIAFALPAGLVAVAVVVLVRTSLYGRIRVAWLWAILGMLLALGTTRITDPALNLWSGLGQELTWVSLVMAVAYGFAGGRTWLRASSFGFKHLSVAVIGIILVLGVFGTTTHFVLSVAQLREVAPVSQTLLPAVGVEDQRSGSKVLSLSVDADRIVAQLWRGYGTELTEASMSGRAKGIDSWATEELAQTIANIIGRSQSVNSALRVHGVSLILVPPGDSLERAQLVAALNALPNITYVSGHESGDFWRVDDVDEPVVHAFVGRPQLLTGVASERIVVIPERVWPHWRARVGDQELDIAKLGWQQAFAVPPGASGELVVEPDNTVHEMLTLVQYLFMAIGILAGLPRIGRRVQL